MKKFGFTLTEMLIALVVLSAVIALTAPMITDMTPNQKKVMIKRSYNITTNVVKDLVENTALYSPFKGDGTEIAYKGFDNTESVKYNGATYSGKSKFRKLFLDSIGATDSSSSSCNINFKSQYTTADANYSCTKATTQNGITWFVMNPEINDVAAFIMVDVNGDKKPNCSQTDDSCKNRSENFDRYTMQVMNDGEVLINKKDSWAKGNIDLYSNIGSD